MKISATFKALFTAACLLTVAGCGPLQEDLPKKPIGGGYGVYYEIFVGSFRDSDGDGVGDLRGITEKLDYLNDGNLASNRSLHVDGIWLTPIHPSPSYHKYDVTDYRAIDPAFGTMEDFEELIAECNRRGVKVIIDLVLNHSSAEHPWFQAARRGDPRYLAYYHTAASKESSHYYPLGFGGRYYEGVFWDQMPDFDFDNPELRKELEDIAAFWIDKGVAGFRLDAALHYYGDRQKSVEALAWFTEYGKSKKDDIYLVGEVWDNPAEILTFYGSGIPSLFNFTFAQEQGMIPRAVSTRNGAALSAGLINWNRALKQKNAAAIDAVFLSNHDHNRSAGYFNQDPVKEKMAAALYLLMPGNPFIYYGEETGMTGSGRDENKRGPMIWSLKDRTGISRGPAGMDQTWAAPAGVEEQLRDPASLTRFYIEAVRLRNKYPVLFSGSPEELQTGDRAVMAYRIEGPSGSAAVLHNLSDQEKTLELAGAKKLGGFLRASGPSAPSLKGTRLRLPPFSTAVVELEPSDD